jgi:hypothetical protein
VIDLFCLVQANALNQLMRLDCQKATYVKNLKPRLDVVPAILAALLARFTPQKVFQLTASVTPQYTFRDLTVANGANVVSLGVGMRHVWFLFPPSVRRTTSPALPSPF